MLNPEFDLLLTALLDGELDPEPRLRVESAVRGDPAAADRLAVLTRVRDLVATLPPPHSSPDVSGEVVALLASRRRSSFRTIRFAAAIVSGLAAAALLMVIGGPRDRRTEGRRVAEQPRLAAPLPSPPAPPRMAAVARPIRPTLVRPTLDVAIREDVLAAEIRQRDDRAGLDGLVRQADGRVIDVLVDEVGPASLGILDEVVRTTSRFKPNHARVQVIQGIEVDPARPGRAWVYILVMDEHEYAKFRRKLDDRFPESVSEPAPIARDSLAALSKVGQVEFFRNTEPAGTLTRPPTDLFTQVAIQSPKPAAGDEHFITPEGKTVRPGEPPASSNPPDQNLGVVAKPDRDSRPSPRLVYVVWVSRRDRPRG